MIEKMDRRAIAGVLCVLPRLGNAMGHERSVATSRFLGPSSRACAWLVTILALVLAGDLSAQIDPPVRRPGPDILLDRNTEAARTLVAFNYRDGAWLAVSGKEWAASSEPSIPAEMRRKLEEFLEKGRSIDVVEFTPQGGWAIVAEDLNWTRNVRGDYYDELGKLSREGRRIRAVAFDPTDWEEERGFVIVHDRGFVARGVPADMQSKLDEFRRLGHEIRVVEFTPTGGWTILTDRGNWTRGVGGTDATSAEIVDPGAALMATGGGTPASPTEYFARLNEVDVRDGFTPHAVAFDPRRYDQRKGYVIVSGDSYWAQDVPPRLAHWLETERGLDGMYARTSGAGRTAEPARRAEPDVVARVKTAIVDLQQIVVEDVQERAGDEPYVVVYPVRGRIGVRDRVLVFDHEKQIGMIRSERNWAEAGGQYDIPTEIGKITFENVQPFEVYGVVTVYGERDPATSTRTRIATFESGEFKNEEGIFNVVADRFNRAVPFDAPRPDYNDLSEANARRVVQRVFEGLERYFDDTFKSQVQTTFEKYQKLNNPRGNGDDLISVSFMFFVNAPGLGDGAVEEIGGDYALPPGSFSGSLSGARSSGGFGVFAVDSNRYIVRGEHRFFAAGGTE